MAGRAIVGTIALYALLLQVFLAAATPKLAFDAPGILCADHNGQSQDGGIPVRHDHGHCCTPAQASDLATPPDVAVSIGWPWRHATTVSWRRDTACLPTGPPSRAQSARGPPLV